MVCFQLFMDTHEDIQPICQYLKTRGWEDKSLKLLSAYDKCEKEPLQIEFTFDSEDIDPFDIIMRPVDHPTELFKSLQQKDWGAVLHCLHKKPTEAKTWIYRETDFPENKLLWKLLPLHAAVALGAPAYVILELLHTYPDAAKQWDSKRSLPIHLAASRIDLDVDGERVLHHLLRVFPESARVINGKGRTPIELAYGAQLRKDRQIKRESKLESDEREPEEEGFELQLEMRDVMESFTNEVAGWSLIDESLSSSYSDGSVVESGIKSQESQFTQSKSNSESNSSSSTDTESAESKSTVAVQSFDVKNAISATSSISLHQSGSDSSTSSSTKSLSHQNSAKSQPSQGKPKSSLSPSVDSEMSVEKETIGLIGMNSVESSRSNQAVARAKSYELPPRQSMYSSPIKSLPDQLPLPKSRSRSIEMKGSIDRYSVNSEPTTIIESKVESMPASSQKRLIHSSELPPKPASSPLKSLPSPIRAFKQRSRSFRKSYSLDCASFEKSRTNGFVDVDGNLSPNDYSTITVSTLSTLSGQHEMICKQSHTFDCTPKQSMYKSPARSLPLPSPLKMFKSRSRSLQKKASLDAYSFDKCSTSSSEDTNGEVTATQSTSPSNETNQLSTSQQNDDNALSLDDMIMHVPSTSSAKSYASRIDVEEANNTSKQFVPESARSTCSTLSARTEAVTPRSDGIDENLNLTKSEQIEQLGNTSLLSTTETSSFERDQVLADFIEEAITSIGAHYTVRRVLNEMHEKKIDTIESLLKLNENPNEFMSVFTDRKLAIEMKRLLDGPTGRVNEASLLDSIYEGGSGNSSSSSSL
jgi:hypothetical protein